MLKNTSVASQCQKDSQCHALQISHNQGSAYLLSLASIPLLTHTSHITTGHPYCAADPLYTCLCWFLKGDAFMSFSKSQLILHNNKRITLGKMPRLYFPGKKGTLLTKSHLDPSVTVLVTQLDTFTEKSIYCSSLHFSLLQAPWGHFWFILVIFCLWLSVCRVSVIWIFYASLSARVLLILISVIYQQGVQVMNSSFLISEMNLQMPLRIP